jgi:dTDP-D-glucose 4,6-dehydratase
MKNKNNKSANDLLNLILDVQRMKGNDFGYACATGTLVSLMDWARESSDPHTLQNEINYQYNRVENELLEIKSKELQKVANKASMEELMA